MQLYQEESKRLKDYMNLLSQENDQLKKEKEEREKKIVDSAVSSTPGNLAASIAQQDDTIVLQKGLKAKEKLIEALKRKIKQANMDNEDLRAKLKEQTQLLKEEKERLEELKEENAHQVDELETQLEKLKEQLSHLKFLQEKEKKENETQQADNFVNQMNLMYSSIGCAGGAGAPGPAGLAITQGGSGFSQSQSLGAQSTMQNFNFYNQNIYQVGSQTSEGNAEFQAKNNEIEDLKSQIKQLKQSLDDAESHQNEAK